MLLQYLGDELTGGLLDGFLLLKSSLSLYFGHGGSEDVGARQKFGIGT
jgi:hypothetical protein